MLARHDVLFYILYPELDPVIEQTPYIQKVAEIRKANSKGESKEAFSLVTDEMVEDLSISGTREECRDKTAKLYDYGITLPIIRVSVKPFKENERKDVFLRAIAVFERLIKYISIQVIIFSYFLRQYNFYSFIILLDKQIFLILDFLCVELQGKTYAIQVEKETYVNLMLLEY